MPSLQLRYSSLEITQYSTGITRYTKSSMHALYIAKPFSLHMCIACDGKIYSNMHVGGSTHSLSSLSPCRSCLWYQLLLPASHTVTSFTYFSNIFYALLTTSNEVCIYIRMCVCMFFFLVTHNMACLPPNYIYIACWMIVIYLCINTSSRVQLACGWVLLDYLQYCRSTPALVWSGCGVTPPQSTLHLTPPHF